MAMMGGFGCALCRQPNHMTEACPMRFAGGNPQMQQQYGNGNGNGNGMYASYPGQPPSVNGQVNGYYAQPQIHAQPQPHMMGMPGQPMYGGNGVGNGMASPPQKLYATPSGGVAGNAMTPMNVYTPPQQEVLFRGPSYHHVPPQHGGPTTVYLQPAGTTQSAQGVPPPGAAPATPQSPQSADGSGDGCCLFICLGGVCAGLYACLKCS